VFSLRFFAAAARHAFPNGRGATLLRTAQPAAAYSLMAAASWKRERIPSFW